MIYCFDLDDTLCEISAEWDRDQYDKADPKTKRIEKVNSLYDGGNKIIIETAQGSVSGKDWHELTEKQLNSWGVKYHVLRAGIKHAADYYIDDKAINASDYFE